MRFKKIVPHSRLYCPFIAPIPALVYLSVYPSMRYEKFKCVDRDIKTIDYSTSLASGLAKNWTLGLRSAKCPPMKPLAADKLVIIWHFLPDHQAIMRTKSSTGCASQS